ncbi:MAG: hypothetical protein QOH27_1799 [Mycobacterium sp.]|nr:hypothetical protein [Mycobacterium sp.]
MIFSGWCPGLSCDTWNKSVGTGVTNLDDAVHDQIDADPYQQIVVFGYSQGGASRRSCTTSMRTPPSTRAKSPSSRSATSTTRWGYGYYLSPNENGETDTLPYGYNDATLAYAIAHTEGRVHDQATFVLIPQQGALPIYQPFVDLATSTGTRALVDPVISLIQPVTKVIINLGYDRTADPGVPQTLSILPADPFQNWFKVGEDLAGATVEGVTNVVNGVDVTKPPTTPPAVSPLVEDKTSNVTDLLSKQTPTVVDKDAAAPVAKVKATPLKDTPLKDTVAKLNDVTKNKPVATAVKKAVGTVKATVDKVKTAVDKVTAPKKTEAAASEKTKDAA